MSDTCPCCGSPVRVHTGGDGTSSYELVVAADALDKARVLADTAARAVTQPSAFCRNDSGLQQELSGAIAQVRLALGALTVKAEPVCGRASGVRCTVPLCPYPDCDAFLRRYKGPRRDCEDCAMTDKARELIREARSCAERKTGTVQVPVARQHLRDLAAALEKALNENVALRARLDTRRGKT